MNNTDRIVQLGGPQFPRWFTILWIAVFLALVALQPERLTGSQARVDREIAALQARVLIANAKQHQTTVAARGR